MKLRDYLPDRLQSAPAVDFENAVQVEVDKLEAAYQTMTENLIVDTSKAWLPLWEWAYGLTGTGEIDARRSAVKAKMRGAATTTEDLIRSVADAYSDEPADLVVDNPAYTFYIYLSSTIGRTPENLDNLRRVLEEIKPAHMAFEIYLQVDKAVQELHWADSVEVMTEYEF